MFILQYNTIEFEGTLSKVPYAYILHGKQLFTDEC